MRKLIALLTAATLFASMTVSAAPSPSAAAVSASGASSEGFRNTLLIVVKGGFPGANYNTATINFYLKGLANGAKVAVKQFVNGVWVDVEVVEVRADHVVLNLVNSGAVAFVQLP